MLLYKYAPVTQYSIENLAQHQLYCSPYEAFNDPFECWFRWAATVPHPDTEPDRFRAALDAWGVEVQDCELDTYHEYMDSLISEGLAREVEFGRDSARITCLCDSPRNLLMWSHYANGLRGFCLELDSDLVLSTRTGGVELIQVQYTSKPAFFDAAAWAVTLDQIEWHEEQIAEVRSTRSDDPWLPEYADWAQKSRERLRDMYTVMFGTKPTEWSYEREYRIVFGADRDGGTATFLSYPPDALRSITIGEKMPDEQREQMLRTVRESSPGATVRVAGRSRDDFSLSITELS